MDATITNELFHMLNITVKASTISIIVNIIFLTVFFLDLSAKAETTGCNIIDKIEDNERTIPIWVLLKPLYCKNTAAKLKNIH
jgi:hypothetical protein